MGMKNKITEAIEIVGLQPLAKELGLTYQAILKWQKSGQLPRTEWTGETNYSAVIERMTGGKVSKDDLLKRRSAA